MKLDPRSGKPIIELSHSGLNTFNSCPKKFAFRKVITNFGEDRQESDATQVGTALHEAIQNYMHTRNEMEALEQLAFHHPVHLRNESKASDYSLESSTYTFLRWLEESELPAYELAYFVKDGVSMPAVEIAFLIVIEFEHVIFHLRGYIDLVVKHPLRGHFLAVDIKTTTPQGAPTLQAKYTWDWQTTSYGIALRALLGHEGTFEAGIMGVIMSDKAPQFPFPSWPRTPFDQEDYQFYLLDSCRRIQDYLLADRFPRNPTSCIAYSKVCPYHTQCGPRDLHGMQMLVNPSGKAGKPERPFDPVFTVHMEAA